MLQIITPATTNNLTTRDTVKQELKITDNLSDNLIDRLIEEASSKITAYCRRTTFGLEVVRQTEYSPETPIILDRDLAINITSLIVADVVSTDYVLDGTRVWRLYSGSLASWDSTQKVVIEYQTGYTLLGGLPQAVERACIDTVKQLYFNGPRDTQLKSEKVLDIVDQSWYSSPQKSEDLPIGIASTLDRFQLEVVV